MKFRKCDSFQIIAISNRRTVQAKYFAVIRLSLCTIFHTIFLRISPCQIGIRFIGSCADSLVITTHRLPEVAFVIGNHSPFQTNRHIRRVIYRRLPNSLFGSGKIAISPLDFRQQSIIFGILRIFLYRSFYIGSRFVESGQPRQTKGPIIIDRMEIEKVLLHDRIPITQRRCIIIMVFINGGTHIIKHTLPGRTFDIPIQPFDNTVIRLVTISDQLLYRSRMPVIERDGIDQIIDRFGHHVHLLINLAALQINLRIFGREIDSLS